MNPELEEREAEIAAYRRRLKEDGEIEEAARELILNRMNRLSEGRKMALSLTLWAVVIIGIIIYIMEAC